MEKGKNYKWLSTVFVMVFWVWVILTIACCLTSCASTKTSESYVERHHVEELMNRVDSLISKSQTTVQDSSWRETFIRELQSIKEHNDTSHTVVVDTAGNVIREKVEIWHERETTSERDRQEIQGLMHKMEKIDSVMEVNRLQTERIDSLLQASQKEKTIIKETPWYEKIWFAVKWFIIGMFLIISVNFLKNTMKK